MEAKKNPGADLSRMSGLFLGVGATLALSMVITAFEWRTTQDPLVDLLPKNGDVFEELVKIPLTEILPPPPKAIPVKIVVVEHEVEAPQPIIDIGTPSVPIVEPIAPAIEPEKEPVDEWFFVVEEPASPKGGLSAFFKYVGNNIKYPPQARRIGIEGKVFVEFIVSRDGTLTDVKVIKGIGGGCDEEAVRIVKSSPSWHPGKQRGKPVRQKFTIPIIFKLG